MSWKNLFIASDDNTTEKTQEPVNTNITKEAQTFSQPQTLSFGSTQPKQMFDTSNEHLEKALEIYKNGFDSLNQNGYDFYEFYQAVVNGGLGNPQIYNMAFAMGLAMDKSISKDKLIQQADYYLNEIKKVYNENVAKGSERRNSLESQKMSEYHALSSELELMKQQMEALKIQIQDKENKLSVIDNKYAPLIKDIDGKITANEIANTRIVNSIQEVKNGIIQNIK